MKQAPTSYLHLYFFQHKYGWRIGVTPKPRNSYLESSLASIAWTSCNLWVRSAKKLCYMVGDHTRYVTTHSVASTHCRSVNPHRTEINYDPVFNMVLTTKTHARKVRP